MTNYATALPGISALLKLNKDKEKEKEADRRFLADFRAAIRDDVRPHKLLIQIQMN